MREKLFLRGDVTTKKCCRCKKERPLDDFNLRGGGRRDHESICRECSHVKRISATAYEKECLIKYLLESGFKQCCSCFEIKSLSKFPLDAREKYGTAGTCRKCKGKKAFNKKWPNGKFKKPNPRKKCFTEEDYRIRNRGYDKKRRDKKNEYRREKRKSDVNFKIGSNLRRRNSRALKTQMATKFFKYDEYIGCTYGFLKEYLCSLFTEGMTWQLFLKGKIHLDHIIPCSKFNLKDPGEQKKCFHYTNLQPLWARDNLRKSNKILKNVG